MCILGHVKTLARTDYLNNTGNKYVTTITVRLKF